MCIYTYTRYHNICILICIYIYICVYIYTHICLSRRAVAGLRVAGGLGVQRGAQELPEPFCLHLRAHTTGDSWLAVYVHRCNSASASLPISNEDPAKSGLEPKRTLNVEGGCFSWCNA